MIERPRIAPWISMAAVDGVGFYLLSERAQRLLAGKVACLVAPLIDGTRSADEIAEQLGDQAPGAEVYYTLALLENEGYLVEADSPAASERDTFWYALGREPQPNGTPPLANGVSLATFSASQGAGMTAALSALGLHVAADAGFAVALTDDYLHPDLGPFNKEAIERRRPWLLCKPAGTVLWVGPLFAPGRTACWDCLAERLRANRPIESYLQRMAGSGTPIHVPQGSLPSSVQTGLNIAATEVARWLACGESVLEGAVLTLDLATLISERHTVVRRPQCPHCGDPKYLSQCQAEPVALERRPKGPVVGGARSSTPEATLERFDHHASRITGIVGQLRRVSQVDDPIAVYAAESNALHRSDGEIVLPKDSRHLSAGKGLTDAQARASALCEALERASGRFQGYEPRVRARYAELGDQAIHPNDCMLFSERQYQERGEWNARGSSVQFVPEPFDQTCEVDWALVWSLSTSAWRFLPAQYCYYDCPEVEGQVFCRADSNGSAAGNNLEEAILHGFFELVERDCVAIWWYNRIRRPGVDLDSFSDPYIDALGRYYERLGREIWMLDVANDLETPAFVAVSRRLGSDSEELIMGFGANFDARIAALHALTEMNQFLVALRRLATTDPREPAFLDPDFHRWLKTAKLADHGFLAPDQAVPLRAAGHYTLPSSDDLLDDIQRAGRIAESHGTELLVLDQTRPDVGLPVVKVVVPGLRPWRPRFGPGRLYDVPVKLGWVERPSLEAHLNPTPMFL